MAVTIVNGFICLTPGLDEVVKAQKWIDPRPAPAEPEVPVKREAIQALPEAKAPDPRLKPGLSALNIVT